MAGAPACRPAQRDRRPARRALLQDRRARAEVRVDVGQHPLTVAPQFSAFGLHQVGRFHAERLSDLADGAVLRSGTA